MSDWFEHRYRCSLCKWQGPESAVAKNVQMTFTAKYPVCPGCGKHKIRVNYPDGRFNKSVLTGYAVHRVCGKWHSENTPCDAP